MLALTSSAGGHVVDCLTGKFLAESESDCLIVKRHSLELYSFSDLENPEADFDVPLQATIQAAHAFKLPGSTFHSFALVTRDLSLVVFHHVTAPEGEFPFEMSVINNVREPHAVSTITPTLCAVQNHLFCAFYPRRLEVIVFKETGVEKKRLFFRDLSVVAMISDDTKLYVKSDTAQTLIHVFDCTKISGALEEEYEDAFAPVFTIRLQNPLWTPVDIVNDSLLCKKGESGIAMFDMEGKKKGKWKVPCSDKVLQLKYPFVVSRDGEIFEFKHENGFVAIETVRNAKSILAVTDTVFVYLTKQEEIIEVFVRETKTVVHLPDTAMSKITSSLVVPHSVANTDRLIVAREQWIRSYGLGYPFAADSVIDLTGNAIFAANGYVVVPAEDRTIVLSNDTLTPVELDGFRCSETTLLFCNFGKQSVQVCPSGINFVGKKFVETEKLHHAVSFSKYLAVAEPQKIVVYEVLENETELKEVRVVNTNDDISAILITESGYAVCGTWKKMSLIIVNIETGSQTEIDVNVVIRSFCEFDGYLFYASSRGEVFAGKFTSDGKIEGSVSKVAGKSAPSLSLIQIDGKTCVFVSGSHGRIIEMKEGNLGLYPTDISAPCQGAVQLDSDRTLIISADGLSVGSFSSPSIILIASTDIEANGSLLPLDQSRFAVVSNECVLELRDSLFLDKVATSKLEHEGLICAESFAIGTNKYLAFCYLEKGNESGAHFVPPGSMSLYRITDSLELSLAASVDMECVATACKFSNGRIYVASGSSLVVYKVTEQDDQKITIEKVTQADAGMIASKLAIDFGRVAVFDQFASAIVFSPELDTCVRDFLAKGLVTGCFLSDITLLVSDHSGNVYHLLIEDSRITTLGRFCVGEKIIGLHKWRPRPDCDREIFLGATSEGSIILFSPLTKQIVDKLAAIEQKLVVELEKQGSLSHSLFRSLVGTNYIEPSCGFIDGDLWRDLDELEDTQQSEVIGSATEESNIISELISQTSMR